MARDHFYMIRLRSWKLVKTTERAKVKDNVTPIRKNFKGSKESSGAESGTLTVEEFQAYAEKLVQFELMKQLPQEHSDEKAISFASLESLQKIKLKIGSEKEKEPESKFHDNVEELTPHLKRTPHKNKD